MPRERDLLRCCSIEQRNGAVNPLWLLSSKMMLIYIMMRVEYTMSLAEPEDPPDPSSSAKSLSTIQFSSKLLVPESKLSPPRMASMSRFYVKLPKLPALVLTKLL